MSNFFENKRNQIILGVVAGVILIGAITLILTGKINLRSIMGNTAQSTYKCPEGQGYKLDGTKCTRTITLGQATRETSCPGGNLINGTCIMNATRKSNYVCSSGTLSGTSCKKAATPKYEYNSMCYAGSTPSGNNCIKDATKTISSYSCPSGGTLSGTNCKKAATKKVSSYSCPSGGTLSGTNCKKAATRTISSYSCPSGGSLSGSYCYKDVGYSTACPSGWTRSSGSQCKKAATPKYSYSCPSGWNKYGSSGTECIKAATPKYNYNCPDGWNKYGSSGMQCIIEKKKNLVGYTCPTGWNKYGSSGTECIIAATMEYSYSCPSGWNKYGSSGMQCATAPKTEYKCSTGTLSGTNCVKTETINATKVEEVIGIICESSHVEKNGKCVCPEGETEVNGKCVQQVLEPEITDEIKPVGPICKSGYDLVNGKCVEIKDVIDNNIIEEVDKICGLGYKKDSNGQCTLCTDGYEKDANGKCVEQKIQTEIIDQIQPTICGLGYKRDENGQCTLCADGYIKDANGKCVRKGVVEDYIINPNCPVGYTLSGNVCTKKETIKATVKYSCANGYTLKNNKCQKTEIKEPTSTFKCPTGYSKSGNSCYRVDSKKASVAYKCESGFNFNKTTRRCEKVSTVPLIQNGYTCPEGYELIEGQGGARICFRAVLVTEQSSCPYVSTGGFCMKYDIIDVAIKNSCPSGYALSGNICTGKTTVSATAKYSCPIGYNLKGKTCNKRITKKVNTNKYCSNGYVLNKNSKCEKTVFVAAKAKYSCPTGYTKAGTNCTRTITSNLITNNINRVG